MVTTFIGTLIRVETCVWASLPGPCIHGTFTFRWKRPQLNTVICDHSTQTSMYCLPRVSAACHDSCPKMLQPAAVSCQAVKANINNLVATSEQELFGYRTIFHGVKPAGNRPQTTAHNSQGLLLCLTRSSHAIAVATRGGVRNRSRDLQNKGSAFTTSSDHWTNSSVDLCRIPFSVNQQSVLQQSVQSWYVDHTSYQAGRWLMDSAQLLWFLWLSKSPVAQ